jgi:hypothetical protein
VWRHMRAALLEAVSLRVKVLTGQCINKFLQEVLRPLDGIFRIRWITGHAYDGY